MKKSVLFSACLILLLSACRKEDINEPQPLPSDAPLLRGIEYVTFLTDTEYEYNPDSTLKKITYSSPVSAGEIIYDYVQKRLVTVSNAASQYQTHYQYDGAGRVIAITNENQIIPTGYRLEFEYVAGRVDKLEYSTRNEAGFQLVYTTEYTYDNEGLLRKAETVSANGQARFSTEITEYSAPCYFNVHSFTGFGLDEYYDVFNYPVVAAMDRLPVRIIKRQSLNQSAWQTIRDITYQYQLTGKVIHQSTTRFVFPQDPAMNSESVARFYY